MDRFVYIHGLGSGASSRSGRELAGLLGTDVICPEYDYARPFSECLSSLRRQIIESVDERNDRLCVMGSSLGGFYALQLRHPAIVHVVAWNPVIFPAMQLEQFLGMNTRFFDGTPWEFTRETLLSYAQAPECFSHLYTITSTGRETPWFQWAKVARRAITMLSGLRYVDAGRIGLIGVDIGAQIAWQTAGMDGRVRALVPINGGGYLWRRGTPRFPGGERELPSDDEERAFSAGVGAETYAKFVSCPTYYIVSSNSSNTDADRAGDILALVPAPSKVLLIVRGSASQISVSAYESLILWLRKNFAHDSKPVPMPEISFRVEENSLYLHLKCSGAPQEVSAYFSSGEPVSFARTWTPLSSPQTVGEDEYLYRIPVRRPDDLVVAFATVTGKDGMLSSSRIAGVIPSDKGVHSSAQKSASASRIVYSGDMGTGLFWVVTDDFFLDESVLAARKGPFGITGVGTSEGTLVLCRTSRDDFSCGKNAVMQMDVYSAHPKTVTFTFVSYPDLTRYSCHVELTGGDFWQKVSLSAPECKDEIGKPLSRFGCCKQLIVSGAENAVFNNIVWL